MPLTSPHTRRAFTLVEILVTLSIIAIISAFAVPAIHKARQKTLSLNAINQAHKIYDATMEFVREQDSSNTKSTFPSSMQWWMNTLEQYGLPKRTWYIPGMSAEFGKAPPNWMFGGAGAYDILYAEDKDEIYLFMSTEKVFYGNLCIMANGRVFFEKQDE